ncbi:MAG: RDD family protein [Bacilli bacterium]|nr:RDD family protein [Bacilli bacterium]
MIYDIQPASILKRISAFILDIILLATIAVGIAYLVSIILKVDNHQQVLQDKYTYYEETYNVKFNLTQEEIDALSEEEKAHYEEVEDIIQHDEELIKEYNLVINLTLITIVLGVLFAVLILEFVIPLIFKNGQTIGKKIFSIIVAKSNSVKISNVQLFVRTIFGKFLIELMIPIYIIVAMFFGTAGRFWVFFLIGLTLLQMILLVATKNHTVIHDAISFCVVCDKQTQKLFASEDELIKYKEKVHSEEVAKTHTY